MPRLRFGTDGVRGVADAELTAELGLALGRAAARVLGRPDRFVIGRDTRVSGPLLEAALAGGLRRRGRRRSSCSACVPDAGGRVRVAPTADVPRRGDLGVAQPVRPTTASSSSPPAGASSPDERRRPRGRARAGDRSTDGRRRRRSSGADRARPTSDGVDALRADHLMARSRAVGSTGSRRASTAPTAPRYAPSAPACCGGSGADVDVINAEPDGRNINDRCGSTHPADAAASGGGRGRRRRAGLRRRRRPRARRRPARRAGRRRPDHRHVRARPAGPGPLTRRHAWSSR